MNRETLQDGQHRLDPDERELLEKTIELQAMEESVTAVRLRLISAIAPVFERVRKKRKLGSKDRKFIDRLAKRLGKTSYGLIGEIKADTDKLLGARIAKLLGERALEGTDPACASKP